MWDGTSTDIMLSIVFTVMIHCMQCKRPIELNDFVREFVRNDSVHKNLLEPKVYKTLSCRVLKTKEINLRFFCSPLALRVAEIEKHRSMDTVLSALQKTKVSMGTASRTPG